MWVAKGSNSIVVSASVDNWIDQQRKGQQDDPAFIELNSFSQQGINIRYPNGVEVVLISDKPGATHKGYYWVYYDPVNRLVLFDYRKTRG